MQAILPPGSVIKDRYIVEDLLGKGGFGAVYLVRDKRVRQNLFALKEVIDPNKRERARFTFEAELLKRVDHPALPRVYRVFEDEQHDRAYILMDYIDGPNLEILRQRMPDRRLPLTRVLSIMRPIMNALDYLHKQHPPIIHRDVKPSNIIVPDSGDEAVLVDFGIAKEFDPEATTTAVRHASPGYGAPEQYGKGTNTRTDIYGLGATIYALLTGKVPADAFFRVTNMGARGVDPLEPVDQLAPDVPQHVVNAIQRAMSIDSNERFASAEEFWQALNDEPVHDAIAAPATPIPDIATLPTDEAAKRSALSEADSVTPALAGQPIIRERRVSSGRKSPLWLLLLAALLVGVAVAALLLPGALNHRGTTGTTASTPKVQHSPVATVTHHVTPSPRPSPSPTPSPVPSPTARPTPPPAPTPTPGGGRTGIPTLASFYSGPIHNNAGINSTMSLSSIQQNQQSFSGFFTVAGPNLIGNGPFNGTVNANGFIEFTVHSNQVAPLFFTGTVQSNGSMGGTYCSLNSAGNCDPAAGGSGTWSVSPSNLGTGSSSMMPPTSGKSIWLDGNLFMERVN